MESAGQLVVRLCRAQGRFCTSDLALDSAAAEATSLTLVVEVGGTKLLFKIHVSQLLFDRAVH
jgi:hypothetical protein